MAHHDVASRMAHHDVSAGMAHHDVATHARAAQATLFVLLHTYMGERYIVTAGPYACRDIKSTQPMFGCFATVLPLVADISADKFFGDFLEEVRDARQLPNNSCQI